MKRYDITESFDHWQNTIVRMEEDERGEWVKYDEVAVLAKRVEELENFILITTGVVMNGGALRAKP